MTPFFWTACCCSSNCMVDFRYFPSESIYTGIHFSETFISDKIITVFSYSSGTYNSFTSTIQASQTLGELAILIIERPKMTKILFSPGVNTAHCKAVSVGLETYTIFFHVCHISAPAPLGLIRILHFLGGNTFKLSLFHKVFLLQWGSLSPHFTIPIVKTAGVLRCRKRYQQCFTTYTVKKIIK